LPRGRSALPSSRCAQARSPSGSSSGRAWPDREYGGPRQSGRWRCGTRAAGRSDLCRHAGRSPARYIPPVPSPLSCAPTGNTLNRPDMTSPPGAERERSPPSPPDEDASRLVVRWTRYLAHTPTGGKGKLRDKAVFQWNLEENRLLVTRVATAHVIGGRVVAARSQVATN